MTGAEDDNDNEDFNDKQAGADKPGDSAAASDETEQLARPVPGLTAPCLDAGMRDAGDASAEAVEADEHGMPAGPEDEIDPRAVEALLFASEQPLSIDALAGLLGGANRAVVREAVAALEEHYAGRGFELVAHGGRWHFQTTADMAHLLRGEREQLRSLSRAATEVLAIVAYHEPVSRAEIESIRGVQTSSGTLGVLMEAGWVRAAGRREVPGRPIIYATTPAFLQHFGLASRRDLPGIDELRAAGLLRPVDEALDSLQIGEDELDAECDPLPDPNPPPEIEANDDGEP